MKIDLELLTKIIEEDGLCPLCHTRLFFAPMPPRNKMEGMQDIRCAKRARYCPACDQYFEEEI